MSLTISLGWWIAPFVFTLIATGIACLKMDRSVHRGDYNFGGAFVALWNGVLLLIAALFSVIAWLIWALLR